MENMTTVVKATIKNLRVGYIVKLGNESVEMIVDGFLGDDTVKCSYKCGDEIIKCDIAIEKLVLCNKPRARPTWLKTYDGAPETKK